MSTEALRRVWLFSEMSQEQLDAISTFTFEKTFGPGELIVEEGHTGNGLYVIVSDNVEVVKGLGTDNQRVIAERGSGMFLERWPCWGSGPGRRACACWTKSSVLESTAGCSLLSLKGIPR